MWSPTPQRFLVMCLVHVHYCTLYRTFFLQRSRSGKSVLLVALLTCLSQNKHWKGRTGLSWLKYIVCKWESRSVVQWEIEWGFFTYFDPWMGVSSRISCSAPGPRPHQVNSVPRAPASLPAGPEAHQKVKSAPPLTRLSLTSFQFWPGLCSALCFSIN